jgi:hypothetical protein
MSMSAEREMPTALRELSDARTAFFEAVSLPLHPPPPPASETEVIKLEAAIGRPLPPSYKAFLLHQDGWPELDSEVSILSVSAMISIKGARENRILRNIAETVGVDAVKRWLVFGLSSRSNSSYLFDPTLQDLSGEWPVVEYDEDEGIEKRHENFTKFLQSSAAEAVEARKEAEQGQDLSDIKF